jgi:ribonuclease HII
MIHVAGVDEVGRGCLAGPMVVGAVILNPSHITNNDVSNEIFQQYNEIKDSKKITEKKREQLAEFIKENAISFAIETIETSQIDLWGISKSTQIGFFNAVSKLKKKAQHVLTDSFPIKTYPLSQQTNIIRGDDLSITIAAASIIAKVYRDRLMAEVHNSGDTYKVYGFDKNKGYGTKLHLEALNRYGKTALHRNSFAPVKDLNYFNDK